MSLAGRTYQDNTGALGELEVTTSGSISWSGTGDYDGIGQVSLSGEYLRYVKTVVAEGPLSTNIDLTLATADLTDSDAVCYDAEPDGTCDAYSISAISGTEQRYGQLVGAERLWAGNHGSDHPGSGRIFQRQRPFVQNIADSSTAVSSANLILSDLCRHPGCGRYNPWRRRSPVFGPLPGDQPVGTAGFSRGERQNCSMT